MFLAVAEERSFTRAAAKLGVSQSALSHSMRRLETKLGLRLLTRTTRSVSPTEIGERLIETLRPALEEIDMKIDQLIGARDQPAGKVRITTGEHAAKTIIWPAMKKIAEEYPDIAIEIMAETSFTDIAAERFDAGVRLGERLEQDMIAVRIGPRLRMATAASPAYFEKHGKPRTPYDLTRHSCINLRMGGGHIYTWEYDRDGRELKVRVEGQLVLNNVDLILDAAVSGHGLVHLLEDRVEPLIQQGLLNRVLEEWCEPFDGYHLYYPSRRQPSHAFTIVLNALRYRD